MDGDAKEEVKAVRGGTLELDAWASSVQPVHQLQLVGGGKVVERVDEQAGTRQLHLHAKARVDRSTWVAARCFSRLVVRHTWPVHAAAHTSPTYIAAGEKGLLSPSDAAFMLTMLEGD